MIEPEQIAKRLLGAPYETLDERAKEVVRHIAGRKYIARNLALDDDGVPTCGQWAADAVARFGDSWTFVGLFGATMLATQHQQLALLTELGASRGP